jgi:hypothetical protein
VERLKGVTVCTVGDEPWRGSLSDRILTAKNRIAALFVSTVSPDSETRIGAAVWRPVSIVPRRNIILQLMLPGPCQRATWLDRLAHRRRTLLGSPSSAHKFH